MATRYSGKCQSNHTRKFIVRSETAWQVASLVYRTRLETENNEKVTKPENIGLKYIDSMFLCGKYTDAVFI